MADGMEFSEKLIWALTVGMHYLGTPQAMNPAREQALAFRSHSGRLSASPGLCTHIFTNPDAYSATKPDSFSKTEDGTHLSAPPPHADEVVKW